MSKIFCFSRVSGLWVIIFEHFIGFENLKAILGCVTVTGFLLFGFSGFLDGLQFSLCLFFKKFSNFTRVGCFFY